MRARRTWRKRIIAAACAVLLLLLVAVFSIDKQLYSDYAAQKLIAAAAEAKVTLSVDQPELFFLGLRGKSISASLPLDRFFLLLAAANAEAAFEPMALAAGRLNGRVNGTVYDGTCSSEFAVPLGGSEARASLDLRDLRLAAHPQIHALGVRGGLLSVHAADLVLQNGRPVDGQVVAILDGLSIPAPMVVPAVVSGQTFPLQIPPIKELSINTRLMFGKDSITIGELNSHSWLGKINGDGVVHLDSGGRVRMLELSAAVFLSREGRALFQPQFAAAALTMLHYKVQSNLQENVERFNVKVTGRPPLLSVELKQTKGTADPKKGRKGLPAPPAKNE